MINGAQFRPKKVSFFRPTAMSVAMAACGIIPAPHLVRELADMALVRQKHDNLNLRPSVRIAF